MAPPKGILIIGGGVIGVCAAYYLAKCGRQVTLLEANDICSGASYGNAGFILYSHIIPLAAPGMLGQGLRWLLDSKSPFYIKPRLSRELISWLWRFQSACRKDRMEKSMVLIRDLYMKSRDLYQDLAEVADLDFGYREKGHLSLYNTKKGYEEAGQEAALMKKFGIEARMLGPSEVRDIEPHIQPDVKGGLYFPGDAHIIPADLVIQMADLIKEYGVDVRTSTEVLGFETERSRITKVRTTRGDFNPADVVLAGGAWSPVLTRDLKISLPIQGAKGYSVTYRTTGNYPSIPLLLKEASVAVTPMGKMVRFAGTLELAGLDLSINQKRIDAFLHNVRGYLPGTENLELIEIWRGLRPCTPDGLPVIGRTRTCENLILATGHATIGMGLGPVTGKLVSQLVAHEVPEINIDPLSIERFA